MDLNYKNHTIKVSDDGEFYATVEGVVMRKRTLKALHHEIDKATASPFKQRNGFIDEADGDAAPKLVAVTVIGVKDARRSRYSRYNQLIVTMPNATVRELTRYQPCYIDTPKNRAAFVAWRKRKIEVEDLKLKLEREVEKLEERCHRIDADEIA